ncbi:hypothetical protein GCK72_018728 [Caenorhabditis remanei]|uniref:SPK domain-containing protein n=1 Tax=Caenorhabditis remanei TaxID=31234 RepID=A0A6A5GBR7_CAERE|nr:hypothetical protein GCK72_018728 [Caenorhabditis remanei]KAF1752174.1 hypothetical protein GCK72_018728 [Caenorhabditis remanei]
MSEKSSISLRSVSSKPFRVSPTTTEDEERDMWDFLLQKIRSVDDGTIRKLDMTSQHEIWEEFRLTNNGMRSHQEYEYRFRTKMANSLCATSYGTKTKTELYYGLSIPVEQKFLEYLRDFGRVTLDDAGCILTFQDNNTSGFRLGDLSSQDDGETNFQEELKMGSNVTSDDQSVQKQEETNDFRGPSKKRRKRETSQSSSEQPLSNFKEEDIMQFWIFLYQKIHTPETEIVKKVKPSSMKNLCHDFTVERNRKIDSVHYERLFYHEMAPFLHRTKLDTNIKIKLYYGLNIIVEKEFLEVLHQKAVVETDESGRIQYYKEKCPDGLYLFEDRVVEKQEKIETSSKTKTKSSVFSINEETDMFMFLLHNVRNPMTGKSERFRISSNLDLWTKFKRYSDGERSPSEYMTRFDLKLAYSLHLTQFTRQMKLEIYYGMNLHVDEKFLKELKATAYVEVDSNGCIVKYRDKHERGFSLGYDEIQEVENASIAKPNEAAKKIKVTVPEESKKSEVPLKINSETQVLAALTAREEFGFDFQQESFSNVASEYDENEDSTRYDTSEDDFSDEYHPHMYNKKKKTENMRLKKKHKTSIKRKIIIERDEEESNVTTESDEEQKKLSTGSDEELEPTCVENDEKADEETLENEKNLENSENDTPRVVVRANPVRMPRRARKKNSGKVEVEDKGSFFETNVYLENLKNALTIMDSPDLDSFHTVIDEHLNSNEENKKEISFSIAFRLIESAVSIAMV